MTNKRRFHRIQLTAKATVHHHDDDHEGTLGAISLGGAAVNFTGSALIPQGDRCTITVVLDDAHPPLRLDGHVTNSSYYRVGIAFELDEEMRQELYRQLKQLTDNPDKLDSEMHLFVAIH